MTSILSRLAVLALVVPLAAGAALADEAPPERPGDDAADVDAGAYLAARNAEAHGDFRAAAGWFDAALARDPANVLLLDGSILAHLDLGEIAAAAAKAAHRVEAGTPSQVADFALIAQAAASDDSEGVISLLEAGHSIGPLFDKLARAWAEFGRGRMSEALTGFDAVAKTRGFEAFGLYHKALALALAGDFEEAERILSGSAGTPIKLDRRGIIARVEILSQLERGQDARDLIDAAFGTRPDPLADALRARLASGKPMTFDVVRSAREGLGEVFHSLALLLNSDADPAYTLMSARIAAALKPDNAEALLLVANELEELGQHDLAVAVYASFDDDSPYHHLAEIGRSDALYASGQKDAAIEVLRKLAQRDGGLLSVQASLAEMLRRDERWADALAAYDAALKLVERPAPEHWALYFSRGVCKERLGRYDAADADFREALKLNPGQPQVLNYLGYGMLERGINLDEALELIRAAVAAEPGSGYIIDSLAWAYFRLGLYEEALAPMEKASLLEPVDPVVTDHLGDVYWMNGRRREAEFQWRRALSFHPEEADAARIRRKLERGLDAVLAEEKEAAPPAVRAAGTDE